MKKLVALIFMACLSLNAFSIEANVLKTSLKERKCGNEKIEVLRVNKSKIESPAKDFISIVQDELEGCYKLLKKKEDISSHISKVSETIQDIQRTDTNWPIDIYVSEIKFLQKHCTIDTIKSSSFETAKMKKKKDGIKKREYSESKESINVKKPKIKERENNAHNEESIYKQATVNNQKNENLSDSICDSRYSTVQQSLTAEQALKDKNTTQESVSEKQKKSGKSAMFFIVIIIIVVVVIRWIRSNMHLFFGGILALLIFLIYGGVKNPVFFWGGAIIDIALWIAYYLYTKRCPHCKKWGVMRNIGRDLIDRIETEDIKKLETKNSKGEVIRTREVPVKKVILVYRVYRKCKHCGYEDSHIVEKEQ